MIPNTVVNHSSTFLLLNRYTAQESRTLTKRMCNGGYSDIEGTSMKLHHNEAEVRVRLQLARVSGGKHKSCFGLSKKAARIPLRTSVLKH